MNDRLRFARVDRVVHVFDTDSGTGVISSVSLCGEERKSTVDVYASPPAKTKLCQTCAEKGMKLREKDDAKEAEEREKRRGAMLQTDLAKYGVHLDDVWETDKGTKFEVVRMDDGKVEVRSEHGPYPSTYQCPLSPVVFHKRLWASWHGSQRPKVEAPKPAPSDLDYPQDPLERLAERDYDRIKAEEAKSLGKAKAAEAKPKTQVGVLDGDIWAMDEGTKFVVIRVHQSVAFCQFLGDRSHFISDLGNGHFFGKLLERNGRPYESKRPQPNRGMDLATYGIHKGDKWQTLGGRRFTVIVPKDDGKGRIQSVIIEDENGARADLDALSLDFFHYLMERDGKNMEEV